MISTKQDDWNYSLYRKKNELLAKEIKTGEKDWKWKSIKWKYKIFNWNDGNSFKCEWT